MKSNEIRNTYLNFFKERGHAVVPSSSLVPENDPSVLFTTAGMQQFKPYYVGKADPLADFGSKNTTSAQKCMRTSDIDEVGDDTHLTFFEMLGNFSFGGYFKEEAIQYGFDFITKEMGLEIDYVSVFEGDSETPADEDSERIWRELDPSITIKKFGRDDNFWGPTGDEGPCGPTTEIYVKGVEVWNIVFNEFYRDKEGVYTPLEQKGIDTGMGLERLLVMVQDVSSIYDTDLFLSLIQKIKESSGKYNERSARIVADHVRTSTFLISDGVEPSNTGQGYILRRLIRRAVRFADHLGFMGDLSGILPVVAETYKETYSNISENISTVVKVLQKEEEQFRKTLERGMKEFEKISSDVSGKEAFDLYQSFGFPLEFTLELAQEKGRTVDVRGFEEEMKKHQDTSRTASAGMFKGGLADASEETVRLHTAHHLLLAALQDVLGKEVKQRGSNITPERLRIDFAFDRKLTEEELKKVEGIVNEKISENLSVVRREMPREEAERMGAEMEFGAKYPEMVSVYFIEDSNGDVFSKEFCGGPHVENTGILGHFKILKEEASSKGVRRIKAVLESRK